MSEQLARDVEEIAGVVLSHTALITALLGVLKSRNLIDQADINEVIDLALVGMENSREVNPRVFDRARNVLEVYARDMGGNRI